MCGELEKLTGKWNSLTESINDGMQGGPLVLFDTLGDTLIISPMSNFMSASMQHKRLAPNSIHYGIMGGVNSIPKNYTVDFMVYYSDQGVNKVNKEFEIDCQLMVDD